MKKELPTYQESAPKKSNKIYSSLTVYHDLENLQRGIEMDVWLTTKKAAELCGVDESTIRRKIYTSEYKSRENVSDKNNTKYLVELTSLPPDAQIKYLESMRDTEEEKEKIIDIDMNYYLHKYGQKGIDQLLRKKAIVEEALAFDEALRNITKQREALAKKHGIGIRSLQNWIKAYEEKGIAGLMRKEKETGKSTVFCLEAERIMKDYYLTDRRRSKTHSYELMVKDAEELGCKGCENCRFKEGSKLRRQLENSGYVVELCEETDQQGLKYSKSDKTASRILKSIPMELVEYARKGRKFWEAKYMIKAKRDKPELANDCWFGDHYKFNAFVIDADGKVARPWLTAWYDIATGCMVGWCLTMNPNSRTIIEALIYGIQPKRGVPFYGVPRYVYTDNGKDYRSHVFEGGKIVEHNYNKGAIEFDETSSSFLQTLSIGNVHAKAYHGWVKPVERFFGTFSDRHVRELPGWCGTDPAERPETFTKDLKKLIKTEGLMTLDELRDWFVDVLEEYHNEPHEGYGGKTPFEMYEAAEKARHDKPSWAMLSIGKMEMVERKVTTQGIQFKNKVYDHSALSHLSNEKVLVRYNRENTDVILVMHHNNFVCAATVKENLKMIEEKPEKVAEHVRSQKNQEFEVKDRIADLTGRRRPKPPKRASANTLTGEIIEDTSSNITVLELEKAMREFNSASEKEKTPDEDTGAAKKRFIKTGESVMNRTTG